MFELDNAAKKVRGVYTVCCMLHLRYTFCHTRQPACALVRALQLEDKQKREREESQRRKLRENELRKRAEESALREASIREERALAEQMALNIAQRSARQMEASLSRADAEVPRVREFCLQELAQCHGVALRLRLRVRLAFDQQRGAMQQGAHFVCRPCDPTLRWELNSVLTGFAYRSR
jgi:hypothetical protein